MLAEIRLECEALSYDCATDANSNRPINRLTTADIILRIFRWVLSVSQSDDSLDVRSLLCLTHVCKTWRELFSESSAISKQLWTHARIDISKIHPNLLEVIAKHSRDTPLRVVCSAVASSDQLRWCATQMRRIEELDVRSTSFFKDTRFVRWYSAKRLRTLRVQYQVPQSHSAPNASARSSLLDHANHLQCLNTGSLQTPALRSLSLEGVRLPWASGRYRNLVDLRIIISCQSLQDDDDFLTVFRESPNLEELTLECMNEEVVLIETDDINPLPTFHHPIPLRKLKHLYLFLRAEDIFYLLREIATPRSSKVSIRAIVSPNKYFPRNSLQPTLLPDDPRCLSCCSALRTIIVDYKERSITGWPTEWDQGLSLEGINVSIFDLTLVVGSSCEFSSGRKLRSGTTLTANDMFQDYLSHFFEKLVSPSFMRQIIFKYSTEVSRDLQSHKVLQHLRSFDVLKYLRFEYCCSNIVKSLFEEAASSACPNNRYLEILAFRHMDLEASPIQEISSNLHWFSDKKLSLSIHGCRIVADKEAEAIHTIETLHKAGYISSNSVIGLTTDPGKEGYLLHYHRDGPSDTGKWVKNN